MNKKKNKLKHIRAIKGGMYSIRERRKEVRYGDTK
ncbi:Uncharacterised protein [uncultured archaeon]|nr:Uncharacterised protein [uncultured archaeon]